jgi:hypothetical protein
MWPYALVVSLGTAAAFFNGKCCRCASRFSLNRKCVQCGQGVCSDCSTEVSQLACLGYHVAFGGRCCDACLEARAAHVAQQEKAANEAHQRVLVQEAEERRLVEATKAVIQYSKNYKGKTDRPRLGMSIDVAHVTDPESARIALSRVAAEHACSIVVDVEIFKDGVLEEGNFKQATWGGRGTI